MAVDDSMTDAASIVARALVDEHSDFLKQSVEMICREIMEAEISRQIGAGLGEASPDRVSHRNGYRSRGWQGPGLPDLR